MKSKIMLIQTLCKMFSSAMTTNLKKIVVSVMRPAGYIKVDTAGLKRLNSS